MLAETLEAAEHAASLVQADVSRRRSRRTRAGDRAGAEVPRESGYLSGPETPSTATSTRAFAGAPVRHEATYVQPSRHHNPMEPSATLAQWDDGTLTMVDATQWAYGVRIVMCALFGIAPEQVRVRSPHTGGAFGCKGIVWPHQIIAAGGGADRAASGADRADARADVQHGPLPAADGADRVACGLGRRAPGRDRARVDQRHLGRATTSSSSPRRRRRRLTRPRRFVCASASSAPTSTWAPRCARPSRGVGSGRWEAR